MQMPMEHTAGAGAAGTLGAGDGRSIAAPPWASVLDRIADGTYVTEAHALAQSFLEYLEHLAGPA
jgi:hypothetical protein